ncbi:MAG TPA: succinate dehydrogenase, cytochrome b556 subunit [Allosphingosinicella sp.]|nr:succinate dehydrogenase, cytochrome b556 subunit [Allosphingosinicella sp.]
MHRNPNRPMAPHLTVYKWGPHMLVSILHRITGAGLAIVGGAALVWWLWAAADGPDSYATFTSWARHWLGVVIGIGLTWALIQHTLTGLRHFALDIGAGYELSTNKKWSLATLLIGVVLTAALWAWILRGLWS